MRTTKAKETSNSRRGRTTAETADARTDHSLERAFARIDQIRKAIKPLPKGMTIKNLIEEGRR
jgi:hypothetical protein